MIFLNVSTKNTINDFTGKTICPFCTNEGSGLANSVADIEKLAPTAERKEGLSVKGSQVQESKELIEDYNSMKEMIIGIPPNFNNIIMSLKELEKMLN